MLKMDGGEALAIPTDVAHSDEVEAAAEAVEKQFGPIDIWVNNAMTTIFSPLKEITPEEFKRATEVTYLGTVYGTMAALKRMYTAEPWMYRASGLRSRLSFYSSASALLRRETRHQRLYRFLALGTHTRSQPYSSDHGADAGPQYAAIQLVQNPPSASSATRPAYFSARSCCRSHRLGCASQAAGSICWWTHRASDRGQ